MFILTAVATGNRRRKDPPARGLLDMRRHQRKRSSNGDDDWIPPNSKLHNVFYQTVF